MEMGLELLVLLIYLVLMMLLGIYEYKRTKGVIDFYLAGKKLGVIVVSFSFFATYFSTAAFLGGGGFGFVAGFQWSAFLIFFHILFAIAAWLIIAPPMKRIADEHGALTIPEIFGMRFGKLSQLVAALIIIVFFQFYMVSIYKGAGNLLEVMLGLDYRTAVLLTAVIVMFYTAIGGFRAVVMTDLVQGILVFIGGVMLFVVLMFYLGGPINAIESLKAAHTVMGSGTKLFELGSVAPPPIMKAGMVIPFILSLTFAISIAQLASPQLVIRFVAAKDSRVIAKGAVLTPLIIGIFALCVFSIGPFGWLIIPQFDDPVKYLKNSDLVVPFIAMKIFPAGLNALILTAIVAAAMSTINSLVHVIATSFVRDVLQNAVKLKKIVLPTRLSVFVFSLVPVIFALNPPDIIVVIVGLSFSVITSAFLIPLLASFYSRTTQLPVVSSMIVAVAVCIIWYLYFYKVYWIYPVVPGLAASALTYVVFLRAERAISAAPG